MNGKKIVDLLEKDVSELKNILSELTIGKSLTVVEYKFIQSRVRTIVDDVDMLRDLFDGNNIEINPNFFSDNITKDEGVKVNTISEISEKVSETLDELSHSLGSSNTINDLFSGIENVSNNVKDSNDSVGDDELNFEQPEPSDDEIVIDSEERNEVDFDEGETDLDDDNLDVNNDNTPKTLADKFEGSTSTLNDKMSSVFEKKDLASKLAGKPISDLTKTINLNDKVRFITEVFSGSSESYQEVINKVNQMNEFDDALKFFENLQNFNQDAPSFNDFIEFVYRRFIK